MTQWAGFRWVVALLVAGARGPVGRTGTVVGGGNVPR